MSKLFDDLSDHLQKLTPEETKAIFDSFRIAREEQEMWDRHNGKVQGGLRPSPCHHMRLIGAPA